MRTFILTGVVALVAMIPAHAVAADAELCGTCHDSPASLAASTGGHTASLACTDCHEDRRPGRFARRHRTVPKCRSCHDTAGHPPRSDGGLRTGNRTCLGCHDPHGSTNLALVQNFVRVSRSRLVPVTFTSEAGAAPGGFTDPQSPGSGLCEVCHRRTEFYRANGTGAAHFTDSCVLCHAHTAAFQPVAGEQSCGICHGDQAERFTKPSLHSTEFACAGCHTEVSAAPGPGHRAVPTCASCHADRATHAPTGGAGFPCTQCHDPHGTDNTHLVLEAVTTPQGALRPIRFDNVLGRADGSFASASAPGTGICEVCHTETRFYRADGAGEEHFPFSCLPCHLHEAGFAPP